METFLDNNSPPISNNEDYQDIQLAETTLESSKGRLPAETPATKINKLVEGFKVPEGVKRQLVLGEALHLQLKENVQQLKTQTEKQIAAKIISGKILRKYNAVGDFSNILSYTNVAQDGPTSQYKNRFNIFFLISKIPKYFKNIQAISWNYSASGHGKGPMDGVGAALKRKADCLVLSGTDISSVESFIKNVPQNSSIEIWEVSSELIKPSKKEMPKKCVAIPQIMSHHQITWSKKNSGLLFLNHTSCFSCETGTKCLHFNQKPPLV
ncbi:unnamed protein product [Psylliodes chrysocephalus]|uniref:Uncharacterized protein n=1 Tax=Psylliodes chrysocephalus TaxID=3402493 RepID=A0A9P0GG60_9CUCU|nr:unnamed protein product [Psylliodes chrysocephala]